MHTFVRRHIHVRLEEARLRALVNELKAASFLRAAIGFRPVRLAWHTVSSPIK